MKTPPILPDKIPAALRALLLPAAVCATLATASAQVTYTWDNGANTHLWGNSTNWVGDPSPLTFGNQTDIIFDNASVVNANNAVSINGHRTIRSLTINADYATSNNATFDIRTYSTFSATARNLTFSAASGNASITVHQSTSGTVQVRLGNNDGGNVILNSNLDLAQNNTFFGGGGFQFDAKVTGNGTINKTGAGLVRFVRDNSGWSGGMNINEGNVTVFANPNAMGTGAWTLGGGANNTTLSVGSTQTFNNAGGIVVADGAGTRTIQNYNSGSSSNPTFNGTIDLQKDVTFHISSFTPDTGDTMTLANTLTGTGELDKSGDGILILAGDNTYAGATTIGNGTLVAVQGTALGSTDNGTSVASGAQLRLVTADAVFGNESLSIAGQGITTGGALRNAAGNNTWQGLVTLAGDATIGAANGTTMTLDTASGNAVESANFGLTFDGAGTNDVKDPLSLGSGSITKIGSGTTILNAVNSYTGNTTVSLGVLSLASGNAIPDANTLIIDGGKVDLGANETVGILVLGNATQGNGTYGSGNSTATHQDDTRFTGNGILTVGDGGGAPSATVAFASSGQAGAEGGPVTLMVTVSGSPSGDLTANVTFDAGNSTATSADVGGFSVQTVTLNATNSYTANITVNITDDTTPEAAETAAFQLSDVTGPATLGSPGTHTVTIAANDSFSTWAAGYGLNGSLTDNYDNDKFTDGEEYAFDLLPNAEEYGNVVASETALSGGNVTLTLAFSGNSAKSDINYVVRRANNPGFTGNTTVGHWNGTDNWTLSEPTYGVNQTQSGAGDVQDINVSLEIPAATEPRQFLKVDIE